MTNSSGMKCLANGWLLTSEKRAGCDRFRETVVHLQPLTLCLDSFMNICCISIYADGSNGPRIEAGQH